MKKGIILLLACVPAIAFAQLKTDTYETSAGNVDITLIGHGSVMIKFNEKIIQIDPYSKVADYSTLPKADLVLITHEHGDHFDRNALETVIRPETFVIANPTVGEQYGRASIMKNGDDVSWEYIRIQAVPAYNIIHKKENGEAYHPEGIGNGYVLVFGDFLVYIAGDTEPIEDMKGLEDIDVAFLPKNLPYTMSDEEFVQAALIVKPKVLYPYHYSEVDKEALQKQLEGIEIR